MKASIKYMFNYYVITHKYTIKSFNNLYSNILYKNM